jgi:type IV secretory pathway VirB2 component (pilin)
MLYSQRVWAEPNRDGSSPGARRWRTEMGRQLTIALFVVVMVAIIVGVDFAFFRNRFWERLTVNIGIVLVFAAFYSRFLRGP